MSNLSAVNCLNPGSVKRLNYAICPCFRVQTNWHQKSPQITRNFHCVCQFCSPVKMPPKTRAWYNVRIIKRKCPKLSKMSVSFSRIHSGQCGPNRPAQFCEPLTARIVQPVFCLSGRSRRMLSSVGVPQNRLPLVYFQ